MLDLRNGNAAEKVLAAPNEFVAAGLDEQCEKGLMDLGLRGFRVQGVGLQDFVEEELPQAIKTLGVGGSGLRV